MKVSALAKVVNTTVDTVRYYSKLGLLTPYKSPENGYKLYDQQQLNRLNFIVNAKQLGFTLDDIKALLAETDKQHAACPLVRDIIQKRHQQVTQQIKQLQQLARVMEQAMNKWQQLPDQAPNGHSVCHLIEAFAQPTQGAK